MICFSRTDFSEQYHIECEAWDVHFEQIISMLVCLSRICQSQHQWCQYNIMWEINNIICLYDAQHITWFSCFIQIFRTTHWWGDRGEGGELSSSFFLICWNKILLLRVELFFRGVLINDWLTFLFHSHNNFFTCLTIGFSCKQRHIGSNTGRDAR